MSRKLVDPELYKLLESSGIIDDAKVVRRVVIDIQAGYPPIVHIERYGDTDLINLFKGLDGIEVQRLYSPKPEEVTE